jgi:5-methylcytosine-specific restriction endonuclease McrA
MDGIGYPKPEPRKRVKARTVRQFAALRKACVDAVWKRDGMRCQRCGYAVMKPSDTDQFFKVGHVHEVIPRSRGGDATDPTNCLLLCPRCHAEAHAHPNH